ncbi:MAG: choice-of-anchor I family protein [Anaerolineales bacterium]|nr:choice-of-anchor I family protein [Anaerolineales bacterium]
MHRLPKSLILFVTSNLTILLCLGLLFWGKAAADSRVPAGGGLTLTLIGQYETGIFGESAAEIPAYDPASQQLFITNSANGVVDVLDISDPTSPALVASLPVSPFAASPNSVAVADGLVAIAAEAADKQAPGSVIFYDTAGTFVDAVTVGALPDMVTFTPDGQKVIVAGEGEPNDAYDNDPLGTVTIIDVGAGPTRFAGGFAANILDFTSFNGGVDPAIRIFGPNASVAQDLEPEYVAVSPDGGTAYVTLQENNALAIVDIGTESITAVLPLGYADFSSGNHRFDASDRDDAINIANWPVFGMYQPDAIAAFEIAGTTYLATANEGDARDYAGFAEEERIKDLTLDATAFPSSATLQLDENIGRLTVTITEGDTDNDEDFDALYMFGSRSFTIWDSAGNLVWDSGDEFEQITAAAYPENFNSDNDEDTFDTRSDNKGPEPEALTTGVIAGHTYAFIGLERIGGIMVYDVTVPQAPVFMTYVNNRQFPPPNPTEGNPALGPDLGVEGLIFIPATVSPNGEFLLVGANEVSGSTTIFQIDAQTPTDVALLGLSGQSPHYDLLTTASLLLLCLVSGTFLLRRTRRSSN